MREVDSIWEWKCVNNKSWFQPNSHLLLLPQRRKWQWCYSIELCVYVSGSQLLLQNALWAKNNQMEKSGIWALQFSAFSWVPELPGTETFKRKSEKNLRDQQASCQWLSLSPAGLYNHLPTFLKIRNSIDLALTMVLCDLWPRRCLTAFRLLWDISDQWHNEEMEKEHFSEADESLKSSSCLDMCLCFALDFLEVNCERN